MAEEVQYSSGPDSATTKRKYEDQTTPPPSLSGGRRPTGFSAPISSQSPDSGHAPPSYNNVPPPADEIQLAKQRAQEIAARLFNNVEAKRPRVENGGGGFDSNDGKGFSSSDLGQKPFISNMTPGSIPVSYGFQGSSRKIDIPSGRVGVIIGKGGETIKYLQLQSGAKIQVTRDMDADPNSLTRMVELTGTSEQISKAEQLINDVLAEAESGGSGVSSRRQTGPQAGAEQFVMRVPNNKVGLIIGKGGETIKNMQVSTGARIQVIPLHLPPGDTSTERTVQIDGTSEQIESAKQLVNEVISENRPRNSSMTGGYSQQGYQARPAGSWAPPGPPMQQPGYGYVQPGAYPGQPQYGVSQPAYGGYPPQPTSGGYANSWDQTTATANQQTSQAGGYDYYGQPTQQQQAPGGTTAPADGTASYSYSQPPASGYNQGQAYSQDGYGGYQATNPQAGYGQPNPVPGYDQQQGYNAATGYANPEGQTPSYGAQGDTSQTAPPVQGQPGYNTAPQPSPSAGSGYPVQGSTQPGYGVAPTSQAGYGTQPPSGYGPGYTQKPPANPSAYGQPQQSPSAQGGYGQPGYPHSQPPAATPGYGAAAAQPGYAQPPYGAAPAGYGQQPAAYGGGYSQAPGYSAADGNAGPVSQSAQPSGVAKASPQG